MAARFATTDDELARLIVEATAAVEVEEAQAAPGREGDRWLLDWHSGMTEFLHQDAADPDSFAIEFVADVEPVIERNKALYNDGDGYGPSREWKRLASFPPIVVEIYKKLWGADPMAKGNEQLLHRMLNDPDLRHFRTAPGSV